MKSTGKQIQDFQTMVVPDDHKKTKNDQVTAFTDSNNNLMKKLKDIG